MEKDICNMFIVESIVEDGNYLNLKGKYILPDEEPFKRGDILTEDKYSGHQIQVVFATEDKDGTPGLILDTKSGDSRITKPLVKIIEGYFLFKEPSNIVLSEPVLFYLRDSDHNEILKDESYYILWNNGELEKFVHNGFDIFHKVIMPRIEEYVGMWNTEEKAYEKAQEFLNKNS